MKTRADLIARLQRSANRTNASDARRMLVVVALLKANDWPGALKAARSLDTIVRERIPFWGWRMLRSASAALEYLQKVG